ncbi:hypothetical protein BX600DRAFT_136939 [Xylariales sp. PMI_506]|nr:hypothetical protein BX600DRAFT_136939 [Xylariales sp. PMI_506]
MFLCFFFSFPYWKRRSHTFGESGAFFLPLFCSCFGGIHSIIPGMHCIIGVSVSLCSCPVFYSLKTLGFTTRLMNTMSLFYPPSVSTVGCLTTYWATVIHFAQELV